MIITFNNQFLTTSWTTELRELKQSIQSSYAPFCVIRKVSVLRSIITLNFKIRAIEDIYVFIR